MSARGCPLQVTQEQRVHRVGPHRLCTEAGSAPNQILDGSMAGFPLWPWACCSTSLRFCLICNGQGSKCTVLWEVPRSRSRWPWGPLLLARPCDLPLIVLLPTAKCKLLPCPPKWRGTQSLLLRHNFQFDVFYWILQNDLMCSQRIILRSF